MPVKSKKVVPKKEIVKYPCMCCTLDKNEKEFYTSKFSKRWNWSNKKVLICKDCIEEMWRDFANSHGGEVATAIVCACMDLPFFKETYLTITENNSFFTMGLYSRQVNNLGQFHMKNFANSIVEGELRKTESEVKESIESKWSRQDKQNMNFAMSIVGYDPFDECGMTNNDRKYCFNILAGYCNDEAVSIDSHKIQCVIQLTHLHLQCKKIDEEINKVFLDVHVDDKRIGDLTSSKKQLLDSISKISKDNNLASNYNESSRKGKDTLGDKMKEMAKDDFEAIKVNLFDIKKSEAMKQTADISHKSILEQLNLDSNDYTDMVKEQREMILKFEAERDELQEENRILKNIIEDMKIKKR